MEQVIKEMLNKGVEMHIAGEFELASKLYAYVIKLQPDHADANHNMGLLKLDSGLELDALPYLQTALQADTSVAQFWLSYIKALITLEKRDEASRILSLAKESGKEGKEFVELKEQLNTPHQAMLRAKTDEQASNQLAPNILEKLKLEQANKLAQQKFSEGSSDEATHIYQDILKRFPKNIKVKQGLLSGNQNIKTISSHPIPQTDIEQLLDLYNQGQLTATVENAKVLTEQYPNAFIVWNILGAANKGLGQTSAAEEAFRRVTILNPNYPDGFNNLGVMLQEQGNLDAAMNAYKKTLSIKSDFASAYNNMGSCLNDLGKRDEAIKAYETAIKIYPNYAEAQNNMGSALQQSGKLKEAIAAYEKAISIQSNYADPHYNLGVVLQEEGKLAKAIEAYKAALCINPDNANGHYNLGTALREQGKLEEAAAAYKSAILVRPNFTNAHYNLANALKEQGKLNDAIEAYYKTIHLKSDHFGAYNNLGLTLSAQGNKDEAMEAYSKAISLNPNFAAAYNNLGAVQQEQNKLELALHSIDQALIIEPNYAEAYNNIGVVHHKAGNIKKAIEALNKAITLKPEYADAHYNIGVTLQKCDKTSEAMEHYKRSIALKPDYAEPYNNLGILLLAQGKAEEAITACKEALSIKPDFDEAYNNLGNAFRERGKVDEAIEAYNNALTVNPNHPDVFHNIGNTLQDQGRLDEAIAAYKKALTLKPNFAAAHRSLSNLISYSSTHEQIELVAKLLHCHDLEDSDRCQLLYAYAKMNEDLGKLDIALKSYVDAGALMKKAIGYNLKQDQKLFSKIKQHELSMKTVKLDLAYEVQPLTPIFILGMPRSGTTLIEQIISSHSKVHAAGELPLVNRYGANLLEESGPLKTNKIVEFRNWYLNELVKISNGHKFVTDKMPHNFCFIGLILKAFPEAKIVHVQRDPAATCWSNFKHYFSAKGLGYSYNLNDTVNFFHLYQDLMTFWEQEYAERIYHINYDELTNEQETKTKHLIEYLSLAWEEACLSPHKNKRNVKTASNQQVRQKVYKGSSNEWRKFEPFLDGELSEFDLK